MNINGREMPEYNFGIVVKNSNDCDKIGDIARKYYPDYKRYPQFNASYDHVYYVIQEYGANVWRHTNEGAQPPEVSEVLTLEEFTKKYLTASETVNNYEIY